MDVEKNENSIPAYVDDYSCREMNRPSLDAALTYLEEVGFEVVVVHSIDRLARDPYIRQTLEMEFFRRSAKVEFALGNYDDSPEGEVRKDIDATFAKWENAKRVEPCNAGSVVKPKKLVGLWRPRKTNEGSILKVLRTFKILPSYQIRFIRWRPDAVWLYSGCKRAWRGFNSFGTGRSRSPDFLSVWRGKLFHAPNSP